MKLVQHFALAFFLLSFTSLFSQEPFPDAISDNSYLIEEAYNQEPGVVQHISNLVYTRPNKDMAFSLTQEWPLFSMTHQISYSIPYSWLNSNSSNGIGDIFVNYRYQLLEGDALAVSPRLSVILPTGDDKKGLGAGKTAYQFNLPISRRLNADWAAHFNGGATLTLGVVETSSGPAPAVITKPKKNNLLTYNIGGSIIWLLRSNFNLMLEYNATFEDNGTTHDATHILNPGFRYAYDVGTLQIVPGLAFPIQLNGTHKTKGVFGYLSFEHPF